MSLRILFILAATSTVCVGGGLMAVERSRFIAGVADNTIILRGAMTALDFAKEDLDAMKNDLRRLKEEFGANHIRLNWHIGAGLTYEERKTMKLPASDKFPDGYYWNVSGALFKQRWLRFFEEIGLPVIINFDTGPTGIGASAQDHRSALWTNGAFRSAAIRHIVEKARFLSDSPAVIGYDIINEPIPPGSRNLVTNGKYQGWQWDASRAESDLPGGAKALAALYNDIIAGIRTFDTERLIVLQPGPFGDTPGFSALLMVTNDARTIFSFHQYAPHWFTHANNKAWSSADASKLEAFPKYPALPDKPSFDFQKLSMGSMFAHAIDFKRERERITGAPCVLWVGEFGTYRYMDSNSQNAWYRETLDRCEQEKIGWCYFVYTPWVFLWLDPFCPNGPEGEHADFMKDSEQKKRFPADPNAVSYFYNKNNGIWRPSFLLVSEYMKRNKR